MASLAQGQKFTRAGDEKRIFKKINSTVKELPDEQSNSNIWNYLLSYLHAKLPEKDKVVQKAVDASGSQEKVSNTE